MKRKLLIIILLSLVVILFLANLILIQYKGKLAIQDSLFSQGQRKAQASLSLKPRTIRVRSGQTFNLTVMLNTNSTDTSGVGSIIHFNPQYLSVKNIVSGKLFGLYPAKEANNYLGEVKISGVSFDPANGKPSKAFSGQGKFATIEFLVKPVSKKELLEVSFEFLNQGNTTDSNIMDAKTAKDILSKVENCQLEILP